MNPEKTPQYHDLQNSEQSLPFPIKKDVTSQGNGSMGNIVEKTETDFMRGNNVITGAILKFPSLWYSIFVESTFVL